MRDWKYEELVSTIQENYELGLQQNRSVDQTIACVTEDFWYYPEEDCIVLNLIDLIQTIRLCIVNLHSVNRTTVEFFIKQLSFVTDELLEKELEPFEIVLLKQSIVDIQEKLQTAKIIL